MLKKWSTIRQCNYPRWWNLSSHATSSKLSAVACLIRSLDHDIVILLLVFRGGCSEEYNVDVAIVFLGWKVLILYLSIFNWLETILGKYSWIKYFFWTEAVPVHRFKKLKVDISDKYCLLIPRSHKTSKFSTFYYDSHGFCFHWPLTCLSPLATSVRHI
jgi:hypothetical protein